MSIQKKLINDLSENEIESILHNFKYGYDYYQDWINLKDCKTIDELIEAMNDSPTEMYTAYDLTTGDELQELKEQFAEKGIEFEFPQVKAYFLTYPLFNMNFHWGEGIDWDENEEESINLPLTVAAANAGMICDKINEILENWDNKEKVDRLLRLTCYYALTSGGRRFDDTTLQAIERIINSYMHSVQYFVNQYQNEETITKHWNQGKLFFLTHLEQNTANAKSTFAQPEFPKEVYAEFVDIATQIEQKTKASISLPNKKMEKLIEWTKENNYPVQDEASIKQMLKEKGIKPSIKTAYAYIAMDLMASMPIIPEKYVQQEIQKNNNIWPTNSLSNLSKFASIYQSLLENPKDEVVYPILVQFAIDTGLTFSTSKKDYLWHCLDRDNPHIKPATGIDLVIQAMEAIRSWVNLLPHDLRNPNYIDSAYISK